MVISRCDVNRREMSKDFPLKTAVNEENGAYYKTGA